MKTLKLVLPLTIIAAICAAVLALVNDITKAPIANIATLKANTAAKAVLPEGVQAIDTREDPAEKSTKIFIGYADAERKTIVGYAVPGVSGKGYGGDIRLMVGLTKDRKVVSYQVLAANETPGLGAKLGDTSFAGQFAGKATAGLKVKKDGGDIEAITGATITSRAVCGAIADACARVDRLEGKSTAGPQKTAVLEGKRILDLSKSENVLKVLPKGTATAEKLQDDAKCPVFVGKDATGKVTGYAVVGMGTGKGPEGEIAMSSLYGFGADGQFARSIRPLPVNQLDISTADMITAQTNAINASMKDAEARLQKTLRAQQ